MSNLNKDKEIDIDGIKNFLSQHQHLLNEALSPITDYTLLMIGCLNRWDEIVEYLISNYSKTLKVNIRTKRGDTALYYAVASGTIECIRLLLSHRNIDVHLPCGRFNKPALWYCYNRECYDLLLREPKYTAINENEKKMAWLWSLCRSDGVKEVKNILETIPPDILPQMKDDVSVMVVLAAESGETKIL